MQSKHPTQAASKVTSEVARDFKPFTENNYRENLKIFTDTNPSRNIDAHHVFPQKFRDFFSEKNMNIDHPKNTTWWEKPFHGRMAREYNDRWQIFIRDHPNATEAEILQEGKKIMSRFGKETNY